MLDEIAGQIVEQFRVGRFPSLVAEVVGRFDDAAAEVVLPEPVYNHTRQ